MLLFSQEGKAQQGHHPPLNELSLSLQNNPFQSFSSEENSAYWHNAWLPGSIQSVQGHDYPGLQMKLDLLNGRLFVKSESDPNPRMMNAILIKSFSLQLNDSMISFHRHLVPVDDVKKPTDVFFIEVVNGDFYLLAKPDKVPQPDGGNLNQTDDRREVIYVDVVKYFIKSPAGKIILFKNSKKIKAEIFGDQLSQLERYAKQNKLRWGKVADLIKITGEANELLTDGR